MGQRHPHAYGERAKAAAELFDGTYALQTLMNLGSAARAFETSRRPEALTISHHAEVMSLPKGEQERILDLAVAGHLSWRAVHPSIEACGGPQRGRLHPRAVSVVMRYSQ